jgi:hypothetical protein
LIDCHEYDSKERKETVEEQVREMADLIRAIIRYDNKSIFKKDLEKIKNDKEMNVYRLKNLLKTDKSMIMLNGIFKDLKYEIQMVLYDELPNE